jgi:hypothetical protein
MVDQIFHDYEAYRDYEVECSYYARHGSYGTKKLNTIHEIKEYFEI